MKKKSQKYISDDNVKVCPSEAERKQSELATTQGASGAEQAVPQGTQSAGIAVAPYDFSYEKIKHKIKPIYKVLFVILLLICIGASFYFSFTSVSLDRYEYDENDDGTCTLSAFNNPGSITELHIDYKMSKTDDGFIQTDEKVTSIDTYAICGDASLEYIYIASWVTDIAYQSFYDCTSLKAIFIDSENPNYTSVSGVMYSKDLTEIIMMPENYYLYEEASLTEADTTSDDKEYRYHILDTVTQISELCFADANKLAYVDLPAGLKSIKTLGFFKCSALKEFNLPEGLEEIASDAFSYCSLPTYLYIPKSVKTIGHHAFYKCTGLSVVNIAASEDEFKNVDCGERWRPDTYISALKLFPKSVPVEYNSVREDR